MFIYDHPSLMSKVSTAFAIPGGVFISADLFTKLLHDDSVARNKNEKSDGVLFAVAHEYSHIIRDHFVRCGQYSHDLANIGQDIRINIDLRLDFGLVAGNHLTNELGCYGVSKEEEIKFEGMPEELICLILKEEAEQQAKEKEKNKNQDQSQDQDQQNQEQGQGPSQSQKQDQSQQNQDQSQGQDQNQQNQEQSQPQSQGQGKGRTGSGKVPDTELYHNLDDLLYTEGSPHKSAIA